MQKIHNEPSISIKTALLVLSHTVHGAMSEVKVNNTDSVCI